MTNTHLLKLILVCCLSLFSIPSLLSQDVECSKITFLLSNKFSLNNLEPGIIIDSSEDDESALTFSVKTTLRLNNPHSDTITLKTNVNISAFGFPMPMLGPRNLMVHSISSEGSLSQLNAWVEQQPRVADSLSDIQLLKFVLPDRNIKHSIVEVEYDVIGGASIARYSDNDNFYSMQQRQEYFYPMDMAIKKIEVVVPDSMKYFLSYRKSGDESFNDINLSYIVKNHYTEYAVRGEKHDLNIYIPNIDIDKDNITESIYDLENCMNKFSKYLKEKHTADIIYMNWRDDVNRRAFGESLGSHIVCDINFGGEDLLHEVIHSFLPSTVQDNTKGEYFIKESIIEWLSLYISDIKIDALEDIEKSDTSLFNTEINNHISWNTIYTYGPAVIEQVALKCGRDNMASIIVSFLENNIGKTITYDDFMEFIKIHLPIGLVLELDSLIKADLNIQA